MTTQNLITMPTEHTNVTPTTEEINALRGSLQSLQDSMRKIAFVAPPADPNAGMPPGGAPPVPPADPNAGMPPAGGVDPQLMEQIARALEEMAAAVQELSARVDAIEQAIGGSQEPPADPNAGMPPAGDPNAGMPPGGAPMM